MVPGTYQVCWCSAGGTVSNACSDDQEFTTNVATLEVGGPTAGVIQSFECITGVACTLPITGAGLNNNDRILIIADYLECGFAPQTSAVVSGGDFSNPRTSGSDTLSRFGGIIMGRHGNFKVCWCGSYNEITCPSCCTQMDHYTVYAGNISSGGPIQGQVDRPPVGVPFHYTISGWGMSSTDRIRIVDKNVICGRAGAETHSLGIEASTVPNGPPTYTEGDPGNRTSASWINIVVLSLAREMRALALQLNVLEGPVWYSPASPVFPLMLRLDIGLINPRGRTESAEDLALLPRSEFTVWYWKAPDSGCDSDEDFSFRAGIISASGVNIGQHWHCAAYFPCTVEIMMSDGLAGGDYLQLVAAAPGARCGTDGRAAATSFTRGTRIRGYEGRDTNGQELVMFEFGSPQAPGVYLACYCQGSVCSTSSVTDLDFFQQAGQVTVMGLQGRDDYHKCYLRGQCRLNLRGAGLDVQDALMLVDPMDNCGQTGSPVSFSIDGPRFFTSAGDRLFIGNLTSTSNEGLESWTFDLGTPIRTGRHRLCYCSRGRAANGIACESRADFDQAAGELFIRGSEFNSELRCEQGESCQVTARGAQFDALDRMVLLKDGAEHSCGMVNSGQYPSWAAPMTPENIQPDAIIPDLWAATWIISSVREPGTYKICYCAYIIGGTPCVEGGQLTPYERYQHQLGTVRVTGSILAVRQVGVTPGYWQPKLPAAKYAVSVEVDVLNTFMKYTCVATTQAAPANFIPRKSDLENCTKDISELSERQRFFPRCWGIGTTVETVTDMGPNLVHVPTHIPDLTLESAAQMHVWCYGRDLCSNERCVMPADNVGLAVPITGGLVSYATNWAATVSTPFALRVPLASDFDVGDPWPRLKIITLDSECDTTQIHRSVMGITCLESGVGMCEPAPMSTLTSGSWGSGRELIWTGIAVTRADKFTVCYCDRHYASTCVAWIPIGSLQVNGPQNSGSMRFVVNPGVPGTVTVHGIGLAARLQVSCVKMCQHSYTSAWGLALNIQPGCCFGFVVFMGMNYVIGRLLRGFNWPICCADGQNVKATRRCGNSTGKSTCRSKTLLMVNSRLNTRPISIQSAICRTIATALAQKDEVKQWVQQHVTPEVHGGVSGRGVHTAVLALASSFQHEHAVLLSLDMKKGYDYADPELVVGHLRRRGLPEHWCQYFAHVWMEQYRWLEWDNHVCPEPEFVSRSLPQGDPFAVLGFVLLLSEAASAARQNASQDEVCALFVDDRTVVVREPRFLQGAFRFWIAWSRRLGFEENLDNLAIVCANPSDEEVVLAQGFEANAVVRQAKVLGVDFQQRGLDSEGRTAETRRKDGLAILQRLRKAPVAVVTKEVLASTRALPRACCGVWFRHFEDSSKFGTQVKYAVQAHRNGSRNLWELFFGPAANPAMYSLQQSFSYLARGMRYWHGQGNGTTEQWEVLISVEGTYNVCWCGGLESSCSSADDYTVFLGTLSVATYRDCEAGQQSISGGKPFKPCLHTDVSSYACPHLVSGAVWDQKGCDLAGQCAWHQAFRSCTASPARFGSSGRSNAIPGTRS
ncbi:unnamed protein product [Symbiodinium pilosum]|uniref:Reverse transcriptase domain-containing protein n=1 Tax=Symbiodinium pilosum TaxID=2952 RepID=A0A812UXW0_SYMPI|nr:unnamed protein product [Symbiodinium pilosum]